jgi:hypothetical protein
MPDRRIPRKTQEIRKLLDRIPQVSFVDWYVFSFNFIICVGYRFISFPIVKYQQLTVFLI